MMLPDLEVAALKSALRYWEWVGYISTAVVGLGCIGEFVAEFTSLLKREERRHGIAKLSLMALILGIAGELLSAARTSQLSGQNVANIEERAASADQKAGEANERAAKNEREAAQLRKDAEGLKLDVATATGQAADANKNAESERLARVKLQKQLQPRRLTSVQKEKLATALGSDPQPILIGSCMLDNDCIDFANDIGDAFKQAHWIPTFGSRTASPYGIIVGFTRGSDPSLVNRWQEKVWLALA